MSGEIELLSQIQNYKKSEEPVTLRERIWLNLALTCQMAEFFEDFKTPG